MTLVMSRGEPMQYLKVHPPARSLNMARWQLWVQNRSREAEPLCIGHQQVIQAVPAWKAHVQRASEWPYCDPNASRSNVLHFLYVWYRQV